MLASMIAAYTKKRQKNLNSWKRSVHQSLRQNVNARHINGQKRNMLKWMRHMRLEESMTGYVHIIMI
jgi:hypothetical protein